MRSGAGGAAAVPAMAATSQGTTCGQQLLNNKSVQLVVEGIVAIGNASMYGVLNGALSTLVGVSADPADLTTLRHRVYYPAPM